MARPRATGLDRQTNAGPACAARVERRSGTAAPRAVAEFVAARDWWASRRRRLRAWRDARSGRCRGQPEGARPDLHHASAFRPCAGTRAADPHRLDGRIGDAGHGVRAAWGWPLLAALLSGHGI